MSFDTVHYLWLLNLLITDTGALSKDNFVVAPAPDMVVEVPICFEAHVDRVSAAFK